MLMLVLLTGCGGGHSYSADSVDATVIDDATGKPLAGVIVVAYWDIYRLTDLPCPVEIEEAVTDKDGKFHIPAWGPRNLDCAISDASPFLYTFKEGYKHQRLLNMMSTMNRIQNSHSDWNGKTIRMVSFPNFSLGPNRGSVSTYQDDFNELNGDLEEIIVGGQGCNWTKVPNLIKAFVQQENDFRSAASTQSSLASTLMIADASILKREPLCGSPKAFVQRLIQEMQK